MKLFFRKAQSRQNSKDTIELRGLNQTVYWEQLDRWNYTGVATPPPHTLYTFLTLGESFQMFLVIMGVHTLAMLIVKIVTSREFRTKNNLLGKFIHVIQNLSLATPYEDWDQDVKTIPQYKEKFHRVNIEMAFCLTVNIVVSLVMLVPLFYTCKLIILTLHSQ